jgi:hypothetical protein
MDERKRPFTSPLEPEGVSDKSVARQASKIIEHSTFFPIQVPSHMTIL